MAWKVWVGGLVVVVGCGGAEKQANAPACPPGQAFDGRVCQATNTATPTPAPNNPTTPSPAPVPSSPPPLATTSCSNSTTPLDAAAAQAATALLAPLAAQKAPGAKPLGPALAGNFQVGQCLETTITLSPGKCYSVVGAGLPTVQNLDLALVPAVVVPGVPQVVAAADNSVGSTAVLGETPNCFKWALPVTGTMKLIVTASAGQGLAAAQVYEK